MAHAALEAADNGDAEIQQPVRDRPRIHDVGGDDKQRHSQQDRTAIKPLQDLFTGQRDIKSRQTEIHNRGQQNGIPDRRADPCQHEQGYKEGGEFKAHVDFSASTAASASSTISSSVLGEPLRNVSTTSQA